MNGLNEGSGMFSWTDGSFYKGNFSNDLPNGYGALNFTNGSSYQGHFKDGKYD